MPKGLGCEQACNQLKYKMPSVDGLRQANLFLHPRLPSAVHEQNNTNVSCKVVARISETMHMMYNEYSTPLSFCFIIKINDIKSLQQNPYWNISYQMSCHLKQLHSTFRELHHKFPCELANHPGVTTLFGLKSSSMQFAKYYGLTGLLELQLQSHWPVQLLTPSLQYVIASRTKDIVFSSCFPPFFTKL